MASLQEESIKHMFIWHTHFENNQRLLYEL
uniref:Uncharacterized protein n=1 Tax=Anguilla anguilla TaxID=7936 RepID=A0A0E9PUH0_ANGAN